MQRVALLDLDPTWVEKLRKDTLVLLKNADRVKTPEQLWELYRAVQVFRERFDTLFFKQFLHQQPKWRKSKLVTLAWGYYMALSLPINFEPDHGALVLTRFLSEAPKWKAKAQRAAQAFFKDVREYFESSPDAASWGLQVKVPARDTVELEGFRVVVYGYAPEEQENEWQLDSFSKLKVALRSYKSAAGARAPLLLKQQVPLIVNFEEKSGRAGAVYDSATRTIEIFMSSNICSDVDRFVHTLAHEMGHHVWKTLGSDAQTFWHDTIRGDWGSLDIAEVLADWPSDAGSYIDLRSLRLRESDPVKALQLEALTHDREGPTTREDLEALLQKGQRTLTVPKTPITGYANANEEEAFCETIGLLVAYGPRTLDPKVKMWIQTTLPGQIKLGSAWTPEATVETAHYLWDLLTDSDPVAARVAARTSRVRRSAS